MDSAEPIRAKGNTPTTGQRPRPPVPEHVEESTLDTLDRLARSLPEEKPVTEIEEPAPPPPGDPKQRAYLAEVEPLPPPTLGFQGGKWYVPDQPGVRHTERMPEMKLLHEPVDTCSVKGRAFVEDPEVQKVPLDLTFLNADLIIVDQLRALQATQFVSKDFVGFIRDVVAGQCGLRFDFSAEAANEVMKELGQSSDEQAPHAANAFLDSQRMLSQVEKKQAWRAYQLAMKERQS